MKPISNEKRELIVEAKKRGESEKSIMKWLNNVSRSSISKIWKLFQETGSFLPKPYKGNNIKITTDDEIRIREAIKNKPDITLLDIIDELSLNISESGLSKRLSKMNLTYKKRRCIPMVESAKML